MATSFTHKIKRRHIVVIVFTSSRGISLSRFRAWCIHTYVHVREHAYALQLSHNIIAIGQGIGVLKLELGLWLLLLALLIIIAEPITW